MNNQKGLTPGAYQLIPVRLWINGLKQQKPGGVCVNTITSLAY